ncbi:MAG TPA: glycosyltransferase [Solirubrobacteraceae bacterium]|nr:glycosyltransferase [Solirubrobacteraceae bacterium]
MDDVALDSETPAPVRSRPLRILAVGNMYPPHHTGGYERAWQDAMHQARAAGHTVRILVSDHHEPGSAGEDDPDVHRTLRWYWDARRYAFRELSAWQRLALERHNHRELDRQLRAFAPDVVSWWSMGCMSLALIEQVRQTGIPAAFLVHDEWLVYGWKRDAWMRIWQGRGRRLARLAGWLTGIPTQVGVAGGLVFNSQYTRRRTLDAGPLVAESTVVYPGIEETFFEAEDPPPWEWRLAYVGRLDRQKGVDVAIRALADLPAQATLTVWGSGDARYLAELHALADRLGVAPRVRFTGFVTGAELRAAYARADAVVFPVRWQEPFGLVPLEAMAMGRMVVATARGGSAEFLVDGENALVFEADDAAALANHVMRLAGDPMLRERLHEGGRATALRYTAGRFAEQTVAEIVRAAGRRVASP